MCNFREKFQIYSNLSNIGEGGLFVNTYFMLDEGEKVAVKFDLPRLKKTIDATGKVVRHIDDQGEDGISPIGLGIEFESLNEDDRTAIKDYITTLEFAK